MKDTHPIKKWLHDRKISEVEIFIPDLSGILRGKIVPCRNFMIDTVRLPESAIAQTLTGEWGVQDDLIDPLDGDMELRPDADACFVVPWAKEPTGQIICDAVSCNGGLIRWAPRSILKRVLRSFQQKGWQPIIAPELEFYISIRDNNPDNPLRPPPGRTGRPGFSKQPFNIDALNEYEVFIEDIYKFAEAQELNVDTLVHEEGVAQFEINFQHGDPLVMADQVLMFKRCVREAAILHGIVATFMANPVEDQPGSSMHIHQSLYSRTDGNNLFSDENGNYTPLFMSYIAGLQKYTPELLPMYLPNINSFRRIAAEWPTTNIHWGINNRTVGFRVPEGNNPNAIRVENRISGADANPYLAIAATLLSGYIGIKDDLKATDELTETGWEHPRGIPITLDSALDKMHDSKMLRESFGHRFVDMYVACKKTEMNNYHRVVSSWERKFLLDI